MWARLLSRQSKTEYVPILCVLHSPKHIWGKIQKPFTSYHHRHHHHLVACCMLLVVLDEIARPRRGLFTRFWFFCQSSRSFCLIIAVLLSIYIHDLNKMNGVQPTMRGHVFSPAWSLSPFFVHWHGKIFDEPSTPRRSAEFVIHAAGRVSHK